MKRRILVLIVENNPSVLTRITLLFGQRGFNIASLTVSPTCASDLSRITIVTYADKDLITQVIKQTSKLVEVQTVELLDEDNAIEKDLLLLKIGTKNYDERKFCDISNVYNAKILDLSPKSLIAELCAVPQVIESYLAELKGFEILELSRTGITAMQRG
ncbi:acetolactate synthase small subunit [Campylobacter troglodytis]|uniref:acetolactate synthase small subunit n=1 Tax=Campylobacter troglodytis TaxID=654363 RepID=UPI001C8DADF1|nr:acetolactate synthase small subunit [Campylobacter troglodytis]